MTRALWNSFLAAAVLAVINVSSARAQQNIDALPPLRLVEELRIGSNADPNVGFSQIGSVAIDRQGQIFVLEQRDKHIRVYSPTGVMIRRISRGGEGPGEFTSPGKIGVRGDTVWVLDRKQGGCVVTIHLFTRTGQHIATHNSSGVRIPTQGDVMVVRPALMLPDGNFLGSLSCQTIGAPAERGLVPPTQSIRVPKVIFNTSGSPIDTIGWDSLPPLAAEPPRIMIEGLSHPLPLPPSNNQFDVELADGFIRIDRPVPQSAVRGVLKFTRTRHNGAPVYAQTFTYSPTRYTDAALGSIAARSAATPTGVYRMVNGVRDVTPFRDPVQAQILIRSRMAFPQFRVAFESASSGVDGSLLIGNSGGAARPSTWTLIDSTGRGHGKIELPPRSQFRWMSGDVIVVTQLDVDDVPWLVRYRIQSR